jgi:pyridoxamine 5'-phosphate oxidase
LSLADLRREYTKDGLREEDLDPDPIRQFQKWLREAASAGVPEPRLMILATTSQNLQPSSRLMFLQEVDQRGFVFFGSSQGRKGQDLARNHWAALNFPWLELERQVNVGGTVIQLGREETAACFRTQSRWRRLAAHAFPQSQGVPDRTGLERRLRAGAAQFPAEDIPLPPHWAGYVLAPAEIEFWQGRPNRLHDRLYYKKAIDGRWTLQRLAP